MKSIFALIGMLVVIGGGIWYFFFKAPATGKKVTPLFEATGKTIMKKA